MRLLLSRRLLLSVVTVAVLALMLNRLLNTLGSSPLVGHLYTSYRRSFTSMAAHTTFPDNLGVVTHGAFTVRPIPILEDNYAYVSNWRSR